MDALGLHDTRDATPIEEAVMHIGIILNHHAACHSERPAAILGDQTLSFHMLSTRSNRLANALIDRGLKPGDRVILYVGNSLALVEAIAAVWKAGGVTVPITPWIVGPGWRLWSAMASLSRFSTARIKRRMWVMP